MYIQLNSKTSFWLLKNEYINPKMLDYFQEFKTLFMYECV